MKKIKGVFIKFLFLPVLATILLTGCIAVEKPTSQEPTSQESTSQESTSQESTSQESAVQNSFTITFDSDGGRKVKSQEKQENELVEKPTLTYKIVYNDGEYELDGWYFGEIKWDFDTMRVKEDMVLKAHWNKIEDYPKPEL